MKIQVMSDLHLEFGPLHVKPASDTVLVLAGDIHVGTRAIPWLEALMYDYKAIVYVAGNHEFYKNDIYEVRTKLKTYFADSNVYFLDNTSVMIEDVLFAGGTMWTDFDNNSHFAKQYARMHMTDFSVIRANGRRFTPELAILEFEETTQKLAKLLEAPARRRVVVTHHLPSWNCIDSIFAGSPLNPAFAANADRLIKQADYWFFGHTHESVDKYLGSCRAVCNPRGYAPYDLNRNFEPNKVIEV